MTIGVLGGGQLGRMLGLAGYPLGMRFRFFDPAADAVAGQLAELHVGAFEDYAAIDRFAAGLDLITFEFENVPVGTIERLAQRHPVYPPADALRQSQDRCLEKALFRELGIPTNESRSVDSLDDLHGAVAELGLPIVLKTRRLGYDGKGQMLLRTANDAEAAWAALPGRQLIAEAFVAFDRELSIIAVRGGDGEMRAYPLTQNVHRGGILTLSRVATDSASEHALAKEYVHRVAARLGYVGVLAIEFFQVGDRLLANEMAPRVHNSGHWTIDATACSQFENHLRAIAGLPLGDTAATRFAAMLNLIGSQPDFAKIMAIPTARLHWYGKSARPGRKVGHVTIAGEDAAEVDQGLELVRTAAGHSTCA